MIVGYRGMRDFDGAPIVRGETGEPVVLRPPRRRPMWRAILGLRSGRRDLACISIGAFLPLLWRWVSGS